MLLFLSLAAFAFLAFWQFGIDWQHITPDKSMQIYIAQEILRGHPPYVAVVFPKTPLTPILSALAILVGNLSGLSDVISVRFLFLIIGSLGVAFTFLLAKTISQSLPARLAATLTLTGFGLWASASATGAEPKLLMILWGIISLWALQEKRWFLTGLAASLAFLSWQPAAIYLFLTLVTTLVLSQKDRRQAFLAALAGAILPLVLLIAYLAMAGALLPAFRQTVLAQIFYATQGGSWTLEGGLFRLGTVLLEDFLRVRATGWGGEAWFLILGSLGWLSFTAVSFLSRIQPSANATQKPNPWPLLISGYWWLLFSIRDLDGIADLIPWLPYLALGVGWSLEVALSLLRRLPIRTVAWSQLAALGALLFILVYGLQDLPGKKRSALTLQDQISRAAELDAFLGPSGQVQIIGDLSFLVLAERSNLTPLIHLGPKHYNLFLHEPGGLEKILETIREAKPEAIILQRVWDYPWSPSFRELAAGKILNPFRANFGDQIQLLGYDLDTSAAYPGGSVKITLYLSATALLRENYTLDLHLLGPDGETYGHGEWEVFPWVKDSPPLWETGAVVRDIFEVPISPDLLAPAFAQIQVAFFGPDERPLPVLSIEGMVLSESILFPTFRVASTTSVQIENPVSFTLADSFRLVGYRIPSTATPGQALEVTLFWQSIKATNIDYQVFVHLVDSGDTIWAQGDSAPRGGFYPTSLWIPGETIQDPHLLPLPPDLAPGEYRLLVGMYLLETGERLPVSGEDGQPLANNEIIIEGLHLE